MSEGGVNYVIHLQVDADQAKTELTTMESGFSHLETSIISTTRRSVNGLQGLLGSVNGLYDAQQRLNIAQISYTLAVRQYGEGSIQAARSLDQLRIAQNGVGLAQERLNLRYIQFALSVGPSLYSTITKLAAAYEGLTVAEWAENASLATKIALMAAAAVALGFLTFGVSAIAGAAAAGATASSIPSTTYNQSITQNNTYNGYANPSTATTLSSNQVARSLRSMGG